VRRGCLSACTGEGWLEEKRPVLALPACHHSTCLPVYLPPCLPATSITNLPHLACLPAEDEVRLRRQQELYEAVRSERNTYSRNVVEVQVGWSWVDSGCVKSQLVERLWAVQGSL
jgi:hypothetical protein